jgi:hypothetical protein
VSCHQAGAEEYEKADSTSPHEGLMKGANSARWSFRAIRTAATWCGARLARLPCAAHAARQEKLSICDRNAIRVDT